MTFNEIGLHVPEVLLPNPDINLTTWSVIACDQYTSQPEYWEKTYELVGENPSTLHMILPEVYLGSPDEPDRITRINATMQEYIATNILIPQRPGFILVNRQTARGISRKGLIVALDLEKYDYIKGSTSLIRATEGTIISRLQPRIRVRENASLEIPHIMVLIDDPDNTVIEPLFEKDFKQVYDFDLMNNGGHITGYKIDEEEVITTIAHNLSKLADPEFFYTRYGVTQKEILLYAMGDGNHSFATAKALWEKIKENADDKKTIMTHPARYALVELVNLHDEGLMFEPIHRVVFSVSVDDVLHEMNTFFAGTGARFSHTEPSYQEYIPKPDSPDHEVTNQVFHIPFVTVRGYGSIVIENPQFHLAVENLQAFLDDYLEHNRHVSIDYIHGKEAVSSLASQPDTIGFFLEPIQKSEIFKTVIMDGALPRKAFSMGEAEEKRFYLESRRIR